MTVTLLSGNTAGLSPAAVHKQQQQIQLHKIQQQTNVHSESRCPIYNFTGPQTCILQYPGPYFNISSALKKIKNHEEQQHPQLQQQQQSSSAAPTFTRTTNTAIAATLLSQLLINNNDNDNRIWTVFIIKIVLIITVITNNIQNTMLRIAWTNITNNNQFLLQLAGL